MQDKKISELDALTSLALGDIIPFVDVSGTPTTKMITFDNLQKSDTIHILLEAGKGLSTNDYDDAAETKLSGIEVSANNYSLPTAAAAVLGGIKVGDRLSINAGVLSADVQTTDTSGLVPYTGATGDVDLGANALTLGGVLTVNGTQEPAFNVTATGADANFVLEALDPLSAAGSNWTTKDGTVWRMENDGTGSFNFRVMSGSYAQPIVLSATTGDILFTAGTGSTGPILSVSVYSGGTGYTVDDVLTLTGGGGTATVTVTGVTEGVITGVSLTTAGDGYYPSIGGVSGGTGNDDAFINIVTVDAANANGGNVTFVVGAKSGSGDDGNFKFQNTGGINAILDTSSLTTSDKTFAFPDVSGTLALASDLGSYLPLVGGTLTGDLLVKPSTDSLTGLVVQDTDANPVLTVDTINNRVGIGTTSPASGADLQSGTTDGASYWGTVAVDSTALSGPQFALRRARGTVGAEAAVTANTSLGTISFRGYTGTTYSGSKANMQAFASGTWDDTSTPTHLLFSTTPAGSTTLAERMRIDNVGNVGIGTTSPSAVVKLTVVANYTDPSTLVYNNYAITTTTLTADSGTGGITTAQWGESRVNNDTFNVNGALPIRGFQGIGRVTGSAGTITAAAGVVGQIISSTVGGTSVITNGYSFYASNPSVTSASSITNWYGYFVPITTSPTNLYGFGSAIAAAATRWNLYMSGTAQNYLAGNLGIGTAVPTNLLSLGGDTARTLWMERRSTTNTAGLNFTVEAGGATNGMVSTADLTGASGGTGYTVNDVLTLATPSLGATAATVTVATVDGSGVILTFTITTKGSKYTVGVKTTTGGTGTGATINVATIESATDKGGGNLVLKSGVATGTQGSEIQLWTSAISTTSATDNTATQKAVLTKGGNLGIGITIPTAKLQVVGDADFHQFIVKANATQTENLVEFQSSAGTVFSSIAGSGKVWLVQNTGGTYAGSIALNVTTDQYPLIAWGSVGGTKAQVLTDVNSGSIYYDFLGSFNLRDTINGGGVTLLSVAHTGGITIPSTTHAAPHGIIYKGASTFIHNFNYGDNGVVTTQGINTFIGTSAGNLTMGSGATQTYHASGNSIVGDHSLYNNTTGYYNSALGTSTLFSNTIGANNMAIGYCALYTNTEGSSNCAIGYSALRYITGAGMSYNVAIGYYSGMFIADGATNCTSISNSVFIGTKTYPLANADTNEVVIGYDIAGKGSNTVIIGNGSVTDTYLQGNINITEAKNIVLGTTTGSKIGASDTAKVSVYNATPIVRQNHIANATDAASAITQINAILVALENFGILKTA